MKLLARLVTLGSRLNQLVGWRLSRLNRWIYRISGGTLGDMVPGATVILLTTTGRKTKRPHTVPVAAWNDGDDLVVGTVIHSPQWLRNLEANATAQVQRKKETYVATAQIITGGQREALITHITRAHPVLEVYARRMPSDAPIVRLVRSD